MSHYLSKKIVTKAVAASRFLGQSFIAVKYAAAVVFMIIFFGGAFIYSANAQTSSIPNLGVEIDTSNAQSYGGPVYFSTNSGLGEGEGYMNLRYNWTVRGPKNEWGFAGPAGTLQLPPGNYFVTLRATDQYQNRFYRNASFSLTDNITGSQNYNQNNPNYNQGGNYGNYGGDYGSYNRDDNYYNQNYNEENYGNNYNGYNNDYYGSRYGNENNRYGGGYHENGYGRGSGNDYYNIGYGGRYNNNSYDNGYYGNNGYNNHNNYNNRLYGNYENYDGYNNYNDYYN